MSEKIQTSVYIGSQKNTPLGTLRLAASDHGLWGLSFGINREEFFALLQRRGSIDLIEDYKRLSLPLAQIAAYLKGENQNLDLPIDWRGMTDFQVQVRKAVMQIPPGVTASYGEIAARVGKPGAARAVGRVNATNPIPLVIPCHRVVGSDGSLTGYGGTGGIQTKRWLLEMERKVNTKL